MAASIRTALTVALMLWSGAAAACGWWDDAEGAASRVDAVLVAPEAQGGADAAALRVPGPDGGYGIAIYHPDQAVPYAKAVGAAAPVRLDRLKEMGFVAVVDLGSPEAEAATHAAKSREVGMRHLHVSVDADRLPTAEGVARFRETVLDATRRPLLVHADDAGMLAALWAMYRRSQGVPALLAVREGEALGLSPVVAERLGLR